MTPYQKNKAKIIDGRTFVFEKALRANVAFVRAWKSDTSGNLVYRMTEQNFNTAMAMAADIVIAEVEYVVPTGEIPPIAIHTQGYFVDYIVQTNMEVEYLGSSASMKSSKRKADDASYEYGKTSLTRA